MHTILTVLGFLAMIITLVIVIGILVRIWKYVAIAHNWFEAFIDNTRKRIFKPRGKKLLLRNTSSKGKNNLSKCHFPKSNTLEIWGGWPGVLAMCLMLLGSVGIFIYAYFTYGNMREFWEAEFVFKTPVFFPLEFLGSLFMGESALLSVESITEIIVISVLETILCSKFPKKNTAIFLLYTTIVALFMPLLTYMIPSQVYAFPLRILELYPDFSGLSFASDAGGIAAFIIGLLVLNILNLALLAVVAVVAIAATVLAIRETLASLRYALVPMAILCIPIVFLYESSVMMYVLPVFALMANVLLLAWRTGVWKNPMEEMIQIPQR